MTGIIHAVFPVTKDILKRQFWISTMGRSGSGVGKGGREGNYAPPVDQYRKRIAKQDSRKEKSHMKEVKYAQETKDVAPKAVKQIVSYS